MRTAGKWGGDRKSGEISKPRWELSSSSQHHGWRVELECLPTAAVLAPSLSLSLPLSLHSSSRTFSTDRERIPTGGARISGQSVGPPRKLPHPAIPSPIVEASARRALCLTLTASLDFAQCASFFCSRINCAYLFFVNVQIAKCCSIAIIDVVELCCEYIREKNAIFFCK